MALSPAADFDFLEAAARRSINDLRRSVHAIPADPERRGAQFLQEVEATLDALSHRVDSRRNEFTAARDAPEREQALRNMQMTNLDVLAFHSCTPWIESTRTTALGLGFIYFTKSMVTALLKHAADVVVTPNNSYMYETIYKPFENAINRLGGTYPTGPPPIIIAYPVQEPGSLFLHLIVAHELGHSLISEKNLTDNVRMSAGQPVRDLLNKAVSEYGAIERVSPAVAVPAVSEILSNWITEVLCDGVALALLGPSFLLTTASFDPPFGGPNPSDSHPPFNIRTRFLLERLASWGWRPLVDGEVGWHIVEWIEARASVPQDTRGKDYFLTLEEALTELSSTIEKEIADHLGSDRFRPENYSGADGQPATELRDLLEHEILPSQLDNGSAAPGNAIILAGWLRALAVEPDEPASLVKVVDDDAFQGFLTKALEMSAILEHWIATP